MGVEQFFVEQINLCKENPLLLSEHMFKTMCLFVESKLGLKRTNLCIWTFY